MGAKLYDGYMIAPGSDEWDRPSAWPNSWTATANRLKPGAETSLMRVSLHRKVVKMQIQQNPNPLPTALISSVVSV